MNQYQVEFDERKNKVLNLLGDTIEYLSQHENQENADSLLELKKNIENNLFSIVLIGEFSAGKSTFLNALMRKKILPSFSDETTATVNFLRHTSQAPHGEKGIVYYRNGEQKALENLDVKTIEKVVSTRGDEGDKKISNTVEKVDLFLDNKFLQNGVMLVDSPGLNGIAENLAGITQRQIKESHASIFMFSADHPGSKTDFETLRDLKRQCSRIFIVLSKIDVIKLSEGTTAESVVENLKKSYVKQFPDDKMPEIYPLAAYKALMARDEKVFEADKDKANGLDRESLEKASRMSEFEDRLWKYLTKGEKIREQLSAPISKILVTLSDNKDSLEKQIQVLSEEQGSEELLKQKEAIEDVIKDLSKKKQSASRSVSQRFNNVVRDAGDKIVSQCDDIVDMVKTEVDALDNVEELKDYADDITHRIDGLFKRMVDHFDDSLRNDFMMIVDEESTEQLNGIEEALAKSTGVEFKMSQNTLKLTVDEVGKRMEADEEKIAKKRAEKEKLEEELEQLEKRSLAASRKERELNDLKREIKEAEERRRYMEETFSPPPPQVYYENETKYEWRGGLGGKILTPIIGKKVVNEQKRKEDTTERDAAIAKQNRILENLNSDIEKLKDRVNRAGSSSEVSSDELNYDIERKKIKLLERQREYEQSIQAFNEGLQRDANRACQKLKVQINNFVRDRTEESRAAISKYLRDSKTQSLKAIEGLLASCIDDELKHQQTKLDKLIEMSQANAQDRDNKLQEANAALDVVTQLLSRGAELEIEIEESMNDTIAEA